jgi:putative aldouronate transport system substrate-binding protein
MSMSTRRSDDSTLASRRRFIAGAMAMGLSATAATRLAAVAQTPAASPVASPPGAQVDYATLADDHVAGTFPLSDEKVTFSVLIPSNDSVGSFEYEDNEFTRWYEERTNVHIEWQVVPREEANTGLNVRLASGDYPEILMSFNPEPAVQQLYGGIGTFIPLNDLIDQFAVEFKRVVEQYPLAMNVITATDGNIYSLPYVNDCFHCAQDRKLFIYQPWLDAVGLSMPTTTDEFHAMLTAFKENDPNGNGEADELPFATCINSWNNEIDLALMNSFVFNPGEPYLFNQDGKITASYMTEGWKKGAAFLAQLFAEGLIDPESFTQTAEQLVAKTSGDEPTRVGVAVGGSWGVFVQWDPADPSGRWAEYKLAPPFKGPDGVQISAYNPYLPFASGNFIITDKCSNPEIAFKWADGLYDLETTMRNVQGSYGTSWRWANEGELGIDGQQAIWAVIPKPPAPEGSGPGSEGWIQTGPSFRSSRVRAGEVLADPALRDTNLDVITEEVLSPYRQPAEMWLPPLFFSEENVALVAEAEATLIPFVKESLVGWITGQQPVEETWESYLEQLQSMGIEQYLQAYQSTFDASQGAS